MLLCVATLCAETSQKCPPTCGTQRSSSNKAFPRAMHSPTARMPTKMQGSNPPYTVRQIPHTQANTPPQGEPQINQIKSIKPQQAGTLGRTYQIAAQTSAGILDPPGAIKSKRFVLSIKAIVDSRIIRFTTVFTSELPNNNRSH